MPLSANRLAVLVVLAALTAPARAQDLDQHKSGAKLFAASCVECHKSPRGLARGRLSFTLSYYLRQHYTSSAASAQTLTAYLQSLDTPRAKAKRGAGKSSATDKAPASGKAPAQGTAAGAAISRMPTGAIPDERPVRPPAKVPGK